jgi:hypothetical protein
MVSLTEISVQFTNEPFSSNEDYLDPFINSDEWYHVAFV